MTATTLFPDGPFDLELKVHITNTETGQIGEAGFDLPPGTLPTEASIRKALLAVVAQIPEGFRLMGRHEFAQAKMAQHTGCAGRKLAVPGPDAFSIDWTE